MPIIAVDKATWEGLTTEQQEFVSTLPRFVDSGTPVLYEDPGTLDQWYVFDDVNYTLDDAALAGAISTLFDQTGYVAAAVILAGLGPNDDVDLFQTVIEGQGNAAHVTARQTLPSDWTVV